MPLTLKQDFPEQVKNWTPVLYKTALSRSKTFSVLIQCSCWQKAFLWTLKLVLNDTLCLNGMHYKDKFQIPGSLYYHFLFLWTRLPANFSWELTRSTWAELKGLCRGGGIGRGEGEHLLVCNSFFLLRFIFLPNYCYSVWVSFLMSVYTIHWKYTIKE